MVPENRKNRARFVYVILIFIIDFFGNLNFKNLDFSTKKKNDNEKCND
jgi:hypothetical protein